MEGRICKNEGCGRPVNGRGMCKSHYEMWRRKNPDMISTRLNEQTVLECMPGTLHQLVERSGLCVPAVNRALRVLNVAGPKRQAYIHDYSPPAGRGKRWEAIYKAGKAGNVRLTKERLKQHASARRRKAEAIRFNRIVPPMQAASWASALGVGP
jgi:hypothetical protein